MAQLDNSLGSSLSLFWTIPFVGMLLSIALFPLLSPRFWHHHFGKISLFWALSTSIPLTYLYGSSALHEIIHVLVAEYLPFVILLGSLYVISGNIYIQGTFSGTPLFNTIYLSIGTCLASLMGTTGASMVLIRPFLRANAWRKNRAYQLVFFIFLVSNIGGSLTPLGDPPLYLGYLKGVPFFWTLNLFLPALICYLFLITIFYFLDKRYYEKEKHNRPNSKEKETLKILGIHNVFLLLAVPATILITGNLKLGEVTLLGIHFKIQEVLRDLIFLLLAGISYFTTPSVVRLRNEFTFFPIKEVAILFFGIFVSMVPALSILQAGEKGALRSIIGLLKEPSHYFWITGILSAFLDNAPTYLTFLSSCLGKFYAGIPEKEAILLLIESKPKFLLAISCGAVFFGAVTYIGNAPNFMVRSIAEEKGIAMPSFFGFLLKYSLPFLFPIFALITLIFFRS